MNNCLQFIFGVCLLLISCAILIMLIAHIHEGTMNYFIDWKKIYNK